MLLTLRSLYEASAAESVEVTASSLTVTGKNIGVADSVTVTAAGVSVAGKTVGLTETTAVTATGLLVIGKTVGLSDATAVTGAALSVVAGTVGSTETTPVMAGGLSVTSGTVVVGDTSGSADNIVITAASLSVAGKTVAVNDNAATSEQRDGFGAPKRDGYKRRPRTVNRLVRNAVTFDELFPQFAKAAREIVEPPGAIAKGEKRQVRRTVAQIEKAVEAVEVAYPALLNPLFSDEVAAQFEAIAAQLEAALQALLLQQVQEALALSYAAHQAALAVQVYLDLEDEALVLLLMVA